MTAFYAGLLIGAALATAVCALLWYGRRALADRARDGECWYVPCGCGGHGDHLACEPDCPGCMHPVGFDIGAPTEHLADTWSGKPVDRTARRAGVTMEKWEAKR